MKLRTYLLLTIVLPLIAACGDDVTNHNYPAPPPAEEEEQPQKPPFEEGKWITDAHSMCYFDILPENRYTLYPVWLLQADGVKRAYEDSEFAQEFISDDIRLQLRNPGAGTRITLRMEESPVCHALERSVVVPQDKTDETIYLAFPVKWNVDALLGWHADKMVELTWNLLLDGKEVDHYTQQLNCRSLHTYYGNTELIPPNTHSSSTKSNDMISAAIPSRIPKITVPYTPRLSSWATWTNTLPWWKS
ncbi:hypothetical protein [Bacteroides rodentium]|uniref:hypothetical protein n=1 Tax=Bacteroides rodentium TaxID=691816 RepID=UPI000A74BD00|nr:hypothetical protein [Bacteroides rodentium]